MKVFAGLVAVFAVVIAISIYEVQGTIVFSYDPIFKYPQQPPKQPPQQPPQQPPRQPPQQPPINPNCGTYVIPAKNETICAANDQQCIVFISEDHIKIYNCQYGTNFQPVAARYCSVLKQTETGYCRV